LSIGQSAISIVNSDGASARIRSVSSAPDTLRALPNAFRLTASSMQDSEGCTHAPRPGSLADGSATTSPPRATTLKREDGSARARQPMQVLTVTSVPTQAATGWAGASVARCGGRYCCSLWREILLLAVAGDTACYGRRRMPLDGDTTPSIGPFLPPDGGPPSAAGIANLQLSSETLRLVLFIRRSLMSSQRQGATRTVEERLQKLKRRKLRGRRGLSFFNRWFSIAAYWP